MKKTQVNDILKNQTERRNVVLTFVLIIVVVSIVTLSFFLIYVNHNKKQYIDYNETGTIDYKVFLNDNDFFHEKYLEKGNQYIASLIDYISANFNYKMELKNDNVKYRYSYNIVANVSVKEKDTNNELYSDTKLLLNKNEQTTDVNILTINEKVDIDYNYYNDLIKKFISVYGLDNTESMLTVSMYINTMGICDDSLVTAEKDPVITLSIPLTTKTIAIDINDNLINNNSVMLCDSTYPNNVVFLVLGIMFGIADIGLIVWIVNYEIKTRTAENIYERELKKILNNYSSYIQSLGNEFDFKNYQLLKVNTFTDMLEIRDTIKQPILMREDSNKLSAYFVIPSSTKILYVYRLKVNDIKKDLN